MEEAGSDQHRLWHGIIIRDYLISTNVPVTPENIEKVKDALKIYFDVGSVSALSRRSYGLLISATGMIFSRERGIEVPLRDAEKTMTELLNQINSNYDSNN